MCGIAGVVGGDPRALRERLLAMAAALVHRGPDGTGLYLDGDVGMANTRLSIVDLVGGDQPIANEDGRLWVVQNGEIYNHPELRQELEAAGHRFRTACDTEVIVHAYEQWGEDCPTHFNGPFAFAVWDRQRERLFLARDRFGVRPLFLANLGDMLLFASEIKALLTYSGLPRRLDPGCLTDLFTLWVTLPDRSAFQGVRELPPGCSLVAERSGRTRERRWWDLPFTAARPRDDGEGALAEELRELLLDAVRLRLRADVPVGAYLSGGLDSSATAAAVRRVSSCHLRTFAVRFEDPRFDEGPHQEQMAAALATELTSVRVGAADIAALFPEVVRLAEQP
ncbi:MAG TPA: asparagine synthase (glutamine-hydrolyzing), partial [Polyangiaceae bacterium]|nr:asparagine synthase (glutamine-hydrolyzing) [Polyangiaceae bacterium]